MSQKNTLCNISVPLNSHEAEGGQRGSGFGGQAKFWVTSLSGDQMGLCCEPLVPPFWRRFVLVNIKILTHIEILFLPVAFCCYLQGNKSPERSCADNLGPVTLECELQRNCGVGAHVN